MITFDDIKQNQRIHAYINKADESLGAMGFTCHGIGHVSKVAHKAHEILTIMGYPEREAELSKIAGYLHDVGNMVNRVAHAQSGALMAFQMLENMGMDASEIATVVTAIGNHDEGTAAPVTAVCAAVILADKSDVLWSRVRNRDFNTFDIHDRVNYAVKESSLTISEDKKYITLDLLIDTKHCAVMDYFEIFLSRMSLCSKAAVKLNLTFSLVINGQKIL